VIVILTTGGEMILKKSVIWAVMLLLPACGWAGYYQYRDASGVVHFTDAIQAVPENQRGALRIHQDLGNTASLPKTAGRAPASGQPQINSAGDLEDSSASDSRLKTLKDDLEAAYRQIAEAKERLPFERPASDDPALIDYARQVRDLNAQIAAYEKKRQEYENGVNAFNQQIQVAADGASLPESP
jgi:outer membrane murein-binding lipoprotein Lpp